MPEIVFECRNCGETRKDNLLPTKHAVVGTAIEFSRQADCCGDPRYMDSSGRVGSLGFIYNRI